jgi:hypothetical protein
MISLLSYSERPSYARAREDAGGASIGSRVGATMETEIIRGSPKWLLQRFSMRGEHALISAC